MNQTIKYPSKLAEMHANDAKIQTELKIGLLNAERLQAQFNKPSDRKITGKAAQYKALLKVCNFKIWVKFHVNKQGKPFTQQEKDANLNRAYIPSLDIVRSGNQKIINLEYSHSELINYLLHKAPRIETAYIFLIDRVQKLEHTIFILNPREPAASQYTDIYFKTIPETGATVIDQLAGQPLRTDEMKYF